MKLITIFFISLFVFLLTTSLATSVFARDYTVTIGHDKVLKECNIHRTSTAVAPHHPEQGAPSVIYASSNAQQAFTHILAESYQEGEAKGWVGAKFLVEASSSGGAQVVEMPAEVSITMKYDLKVDFDVSPPEEGGGGSAHAVVYGIIAGKQTTVDEIGFVHHSNSGQSSGTITLKDGLMLHAGENYEVLAHIYSYGDVYIGGYADSQSRVSVEEIRIDFSHEYTYKRKKTVNYARKWLDEPNKKFRNFGDTDCTNFVSQCLLAGGWPEVGNDNYEANYQNSAAWYYDGYYRPYYSHTWAVADDFSKFLSIDSGRGEKCSLEKKPWCDYFKMGDIVQLDYENDGEWDHTMIITRVVPPGIGVPVDMYVTYHWADSEYVSLTYLMNKYPDAKFMGYRLEDQFYH